MTLDELSDRASIPVVSVQRFLAARRAINLETLDCLSRALGVSPLDILEQALAQAHRGDPELVARMMAGMDGNAPGETSSQIDDSVTQST